MDLSRLNLSKLEKKEAEKVKAEKEKTLPPTYVSKKGFVEMPVLRGFTEISSLYAFLTVFDAFICGGYVRYMAAPVQSPVSAADVDIYCKTKDVFDKLQKALKEKGLEVRHENNMALTMKRPEDPKHPFFASPPIQLIKPVREGRVVASGSMEEILENFDFTVIRCGLKNPLTAVVDADFEHDESKKILRLKNIHCPVSSTLRCMKYSRRGYWLPPMQAARLFMDWDRRDEDYRFRLLDFIEKTSKGEGLTQEEVDELEEMMRID